MNHEINRLIHFAFLHGMIKEADIDYAVNLLLDLLKQESFEKEDISEDLENPAPILEAMLARAVDMGVIEDSQVQKDLFDCKIMNCVMPRPSEVVERFYTLYAENPKKATDDYYALSIASNYIRKTRTDKNIRWKSQVKYGEIEISINLSKPEKDPKDIAKARLLKSSNYPACLLCKENVGFAGDLKRDGRVTHRIIPVDLNGKAYYLQYSPYVYYNEHCIVFNKEHVPMKISRQTFENLLAFVEKFPHYMLGSNADLPIVGGSILSHDHYQGGSYHFPIQDAQVLETFNFKAYPHTDVSLLNWPLTTIRLQSASKEEIVALSEKMLLSWKAYSCPELSILAFTENTPHNTITPICRMNNGRFEMDLVLRNNRTSEIYPDGIFHPHQENHHIKKENIGLIEVMGLAVLPARLKEELALLEDVLTGKTTFEAHECLLKHEVWYNELKSKEIPASQVHDALLQGVSEIFTNVLENAGVFKLDETYARETLCAWIKEVGGEQNEG